jgi:hypothetical protein
MENARSGVGDGRRQVVQSRVVEVSQVGEHLTVATAAVGRRSTAVGRCTGAFFIKIRVFACLF